MKIWEINPKYKDWDVKGTEGDGTPYIETEISFIWLYDYYIEKEQ